MKYEIQDGCSRYVSCDLSGELEAVLPKAMPTVIVKLFPNKWPHSNAAKSLSVLKIYRCALRVQMQVPLFKKAANVTSPNVHIFVATTG